MRFPTTVHLPTPTGPIKICSVWEFMSEVSKEYCARFHEQVKLAHHRDFASMRYSPWPQHSAVAASTHALIQNPIRLLTELKRTTSKLEITRVITLTEMLEEVSMKSADNMGYITHCFTVGKDLYAVVGYEDVKLFVTDGMKQQLVCIKPNRNFIVKAKNMRIA